MSQIEEILHHRVLVLDGGLGSQLQKSGLSDQDFRVPGSDRTVPGNFDLLSLTRPDIISSVHKSYLEAGADIISTDTFNANAISQAEYGTVDLVPEMNLMACRTAKKLALEYSTPEKPRFVAGSVGPTGKSASMSADVMDPSARSVSFNQLSEAYYVQISAMIEGGADIILLETVFDTLNLKAGIIAARRAFKDSGITLPIMLSMTISDKSGRNLSGQTIEAFLASVSQASPLSIGLNCSMGPEQMLPLLRTLSQNVSCFTSAHPNAGLPDEFGHYSETPERFSGWIDRFLEERLVNIVGGCCGTTPEHIALVASSAAKATPRELPQKSTTMVVSGLEPLRIDKDSNFIHIGERCNMAGSRKFANLIREGNFTEAVEIARRQIEDGARVIDINLDDAMTDGVSSIQKFLRLLASEPEIARVPIMVDASSWEIIETGLQNIQGKSIINSISLKEGEDIFLDRASRIKSYGAAVVVMAFDEEGQATSFERRIQICSRAYRLLTQKLDFPPQDIIFDPNILTICTGIEEHDNYALDFIKAVRWIKENLPFAKVSGGVSNLSFSFRGNTPLREAMHSVFLFHAINAGMDMAIVNAGALPGYEDIDPQLRERLEDAILNRRKDATERLLEVAASFRSASSSDGTKETDWRGSSLEERVSYALVKGIDSYVEEDMNEALKVYPSALDIIESLLMKALNIVGERFSQGKMFLPQVVRSARVMKSAVDVLKPYVRKDEDTASESRNKVLIATVKGDVHDIGKNIVSLVLSCNNFEVTDLGVMVPPQDIVDAALKNHPDLICLSGLISPSLDQMIETVRCLQMNGLTIPVVVGGATTSDLHTAVKIAPEATFPIFHSLNASDQSRIASCLCSDNLRASLILENSRKQESLRRQWSEKSAQDKAPVGKFNIDFDKYPTPVPNFIGHKLLESIPLKTIRGFINWTSFFAGWQIPGRYPEVFSNPEKGAEAKRLFEEANLLLDGWEADGICAKAAFVITPAVGSGENIILPEYRQCIHCPGRPGKDERLSLADFVSAQDHIGLFAVTVDCPKSEDNLDNLMAELLSHRLVEAASEWLHREVRENYWGYEPMGLSPEECLMGHFQGIRPAFGYGSLPTHSLKRMAFDILHAEKLLGMELTETFAMKPSSSICGIYLANPKCFYFI